MPAINFTPKEVALLGAIIQRTAISVDWTEVATEVGFNTPKQARDKWYPIRDKLIGAVKEDGEAAGGGNGTPNPKPKKATTPRKRSNADADDDETPAKKKATPRKAKSATPVSKDEKTNVKVETEEDGEPNEAGEMMDGLGS